jgi:FkbM family methyltransferase
MKRFAKKILRLPFLLLEQITLNGESILLRFANAALSEPIKLQLAKQALTDLVGRRSPEKRFKVGTYFNALNDGSALATRFAENLIDNIALYESQLGQECIVDTIFNGKKNGVFVEIGVGDGKNISNTYFLEKHRNWNGLLCEPSVKFHDSIRRDRKAKLVDAAVYDRTGLELQFSEVVGSEELSTLSDQKTFDSHDRSAARKYLVTTISFNDLYRKHLEPSTIDYLSVDTEGSELVILGGINFGAIDISVISVEHSYNASKLKELKNLLEPAGYVEILGGVFDFDALFVKKEIAERLMAS